MHPHCTNQMQASPFTGNYTATTWKCAVYLAVIGNLDWQLLMLFENQKQQNLNPGFP